MRYVCHFSCGAASAVAAKLTIAQHGPENVLILNAFIKEEHEDNRRFLADCERWFGVPITVLRAEKYDASTDEVWRQRRYMKGPNGAPCSTELKRKLLSSVAQPDDIHVMGYTREEEERFFDRQQHTPSMTFAAPLIERGLDKGDCLAMVERAGIQIPLMYRLGYANANCIGCPKGGQSYWQNIRADFPERFSTIMQIQEEIGSGANFLRFRNGPRKEERMSLKDLPLGRGDMRAEGDWSCSFFCDLAEQEIERAA